LTALAADTQHSFRFCTSLATVYDADGFLGVQADLDGTEQGGLSSGADAAPTQGIGGAPDYEMVMPFGSYARHSDPVVDSNGTPDPANAGLDLVLYEGGRGYVMPLTDPRTTAILPPIEKGSHWVHAANGISGMMIRGAGQYQGQVSLMTTTDGTPGGQTVGLRVWPDAFARTAPWGTESFDANGYHLVIPGVELHLGSVGGLPAPASSLGSYASIKAATIGMSASIVKLGVPGPLGYSPVVVMNAGEIAYRAALLAAIEALQTAIAALVSSPGGGPVTSAALPAAVTAIQTLAAIQPALTCVSSAACAA
jgi:hypothetical protein